MVRHDVGWLEVLGQHIGRTYLRWIWGTLALVFGLMTIALCLHPFVLLTPDFSPSSSIIGAHLPPLPLFRA